MATLLEEARRTRAERLAQKSLQNTMLNQPLAGAFGNQERERRARARGISNNIFTVDAKELRPNNAAGSPVSQALAINNQSPPPPQDPLIQSEPGQKLPRMSGRRSDIRGVKMADSTIERVVYERSYDGRQRRGGDLREMARSLADKNYAFGFMAKADVQRTLATLAPEEHGKFLNYYKKERYRLAPKYLVLRGVDHLYERTIGRVEERIYKKMDRIHDNMIDPNAKATITRRVYRKYYERRSRGNSYIGAGFRIIGEQISKGIKNVSNKVIGTARTAAAVTGINKAIGVARGIGSTVGKVTSTISLANKGLGKAISGGTASALAGFAISGANPAVALATFVPGAVIGFRKAVTDSIASMNIREVNSYTKRLPKILARPLRSFWLQNNKNYQMVIGKNSKLNLAANAGNLGRTPPIATGAAGTVANASGNAISRRFVTPLMNRIGMLSRANNYGGIGAAVGGLVGGVPGAIAGFAVGALAGAGIEAIGNAAINKFMPAISGSALSKIATLVPWQSVLSQGQGIQYITKQINATFGDKSLLHESEKSLYGGAEALSLPTVFKAVNIGQYLAGVYGASRFITNPGGLSTVTEIIRQNPTFKSLIARFPILRNLTSGIGNIAKTLGISGAGAVGGLSTRALALRMGAGGLAGSLIAGLIAQSFGLPVGLFAGIGGAVGSFAGAVIGTKVGFGILSPFTAFIGTTIGQVIGQTIGSLIDKVVGSFLGNIVPFVPNPLAILQGIADLYRFMNQEIRKLSDYGDLALISISLISFFVIVAQLVNPNATVPPDTDCSGGNCTFAIDGPRLSIYAQDFELIDDYTLEINGNSDSKYLISGVLSVTPNEDKIILKTQDNREVVISNSGNYVFDVYENKLVASGKSAKLNIFRQPESEVAGNPSNSAFASIGNFNTTDQNGSVAGINTQPQESKICDELPNICGL